ncbi:MAG TPA: adenylate cyclase [Bacteroidales bacterium]|jgi:adenylate cyclase, class 2|nr:adenylate cyclase [Bacteroidales bacterium]HBZ20312.1 adenylate cyclase [Bacteroidales bacterium]
MILRNYEFKAKTANPDKLEKKLLKLNPVYRGEDHQIDTYFNVPSGRLKLREGKIENALIYYERPDIPDKKQADIILYRHSPEISLKDILTKIHGIKTVVEKTRRIYFIDNVKFHFDNVKNLGTFVEVEAIDETGQIPTEDLKEQCNRYFSFFELKSADYVSNSYSDMIP